LTPLGSAPLEVVHRDLDRVADRVPALQEHRKPGDDVRQDPLDREPGEDEEEGRAGERSQPVEAAEELADREDGRGRERDVPHGRAEDRDLRLTALEPPQPAGLRQIDVRRASVGPHDHAQRDERRGPGEEPGCSEEQHDDNGVAHGVHRQAIGVTPAVGSEFKHLLQGLTGS
jgi:hypothetical protein